MLSSMSEHLMKDSGDVVPLTTVPVVFTTEGHMTHILDMEALTGNVQLAESSYDGESLSSSVTHSGDFPVVLQTSGVDMLNNLTDAKTDSEITLLQPVHDTKVATTCSSLVLPKVEIDFDKDLLTAGEMSEPESSKSLTNLHSTLVELHDVNRPVTDMPVVLSGANLSLSAPSDGKSLDHCVEGDKMCDDGNNLGTNESSTSLPVVIKADGGASAIPTVLSDTGDSFDIETSAGDKSEMSPSPMFSEGAVLVETPQGLMLSVGDELRAVTLTEGPDSQGNHLLSISNNCIPVALLSQCQQGGLLEEQDGGAVYQSTEDGEVGADGAIVCTTELPLVTQQVLTESVPEDGEPKKKNRGWPKGKKRKPTPEVSGPKAPMTGYVLFAINRRQEIKQSHPHLPFTEVTKVLGQEWSNMALDKKQKFLDEAENDKQRYIDELKQFQKSEMYQNLVKKRRINDDAADDVDDETEDENDELHCRVCKLYFSSLHNKKEHLLGKQHLQAITDQLKKEIKKQQKEQEAELRDPLAGMDMGELADNSGMFLTEPADTPSTYPCSCWSKPVNVSESISDFIHRVYERDQEIFKLRRLLRKHSQENYSKCTQMQELKNYENKLRQELRNLSAHTSILSGHINTLKMVPSLFGVGDI